MCVCFRGRAGRGGFSPWMTTQSVTTSLRWWAARLFVFPLTCFCVTVVFVCIHVWIVLMSVPGEGASPSYSTEGHSESPWMSREVRVSQMWITESNRPIILLSTYWVNIQITTDYTLNRSNNRLARRTDNSFKFDIQTIKRGLSSIHFHQFFLFFSAR